ncbi:sensor histidine kinase [Hyalangium minutum]|uniref:histidine kinase n=1 Tax=Hyalangium minutum TaxID=394096 RepID=A0A085WWZ5_9BACT|nr:HAMP domain-containing sensor histidine kinase [Hyalangium minutum]KFE72208.1 Sensor histidine kinase [Hyalangium minutum]
MKLARKITLALTLLAIVVIAVLEVFEVRRELARSELDMRHDHRLLGHTLAGSIGKAWSQAGEQEALMLLDQANRFQDQIHLRWVWLDAGSARSLPSDMPPGLLTALRSGRDSWRVDASVTPGVLYTYMPVLVGGRLGAIELSESLIQQQQHLRTAVVGATVATGVIAVAFLMAAMAMGRRLVGYPVQQLVDLAHRIGEGNLEARVQLHQKDELSTLGTAMNRMGEMLQKAREDIAVEMAGRLAALEHLRHADRLNTVGKLASGVAHELGTPLNVVLGRSKMISSGEAEGDEVRECAQIISQQAQHMTHIIRQLLDFARRRPPERAPEDLGQLTARTLSLLRPLAAKRGVNLLSEVPEAWVLEVDAGQLQQVLTNLVVNGVQASKPSTTVRIRAADVRATPPPDVGGPEAEWTRLEVEDEGEGIAPDVLPHIFEPFFTTKDVGEGTGLGLAVSYGLVRDHGGWIDVRSEQGRGSCFSIYLPKARPQQPGEQGTGP